MNESMHHDHDLDLVSALAEGRLADPAPAEELVASCDECAAAYSAHLIVLEAVEAEPTPRMNDIERGGLHSSLWEQVGGAAAGEDGAPYRSSSPWWYRLAPVAAVLVVVVGVGANLMSSGGDSTDVARVEEETTADTESAGGEDATEMAPLADEPHTDRTESAAPPDTTADGDDSTASAESGATFSRQELPEAVDDFRRRAEEGAVPERFDCQAPSESTGPPLAVEPASVEGEEVWFAAYGEPEEPGPVVVFRRSDCEVVFTDE